MGTLYVVSTPIGNLRDITYRAVETLRGVSRILAEDTRHSAILLRHYDIKTPLVSAHEHNEAARASQVITWLEEGDDLALISDAGTPLLSDPGLRIVRAVLDAGFAVVPIPGASALLAALVGAGIDAEPFTFFGFLAKSGKERRNALTAIAGLPHTAVLYEAPGRVSKLLADLLAACGPDRTVAVARELTKMHETFVRGTLEEVASYYRNESVRGEVVVVLSGSTAVAQDDRQEDAAEAARALVGAGKSTRDVVKEISTRFGLPRNAAYDLVQKIHQAAGDAT